MRVDQRGGLRLGQVHDHGVGFGASGQTSPSTAGHLPCGRPFGPGQTIHLTTAIGGVLLTGPICLPMIRRAHAGDRRSVPHDGTRADVEMTRRTELKPSWETVAVPAVAAWPACASSSQHVRFEVREPAVARRLQQRVEQVRAQPPPVTRHDGDGQFPVAVLQWPRARFLPPSRWADRRCTRRARSADRRRHRWRLPSGAGTPVGVVRGEEAEVLVLERQIGEEPGSSAPSSARVDRITRTSPPSGRDARSRQLLCHPMMSGRRRRP